MTQVLRFHEGNAGIVRWVKVLNRIDDEN